jgi:hypothetical protein
MFPDSISNQNVRVGGIFCDLAKAFLLYKS